MADAEDERRIAEALAYGREAFGTTLVLETADFQILYIDQTETWLISILDSEFERTRLRAEGAFLATLNVREEFACTLRSRSARPSS